MKKQEVQELLAEISIQYMTDPRTSPETSGALGEHIRRNLPEGYEEGFMDILHDKALEMMSDSLEGFFASARQDA